ncbi:uncharacterized protein LOC125869758 [Solanum stenotomum]|uniref:uncharacterized protein LOC125869758 n=1 Tax=Solanum stenotomum TaxID=172797 RepID=UPI0020D065E1|nr:uncharacterized protein LOC125869758 [Solanum stenotomum]
MSGYAKYMKELVTNKRMIDYITIELPQTCCVLIQKNDVLKRDDLGAFTIPCTISKCSFAKSLSDHRSSIHLMPLMIFDNLGLDKPKQMNMGLVMVDHSIKKPVDVVYDMLVKVDKFVFHIDFVVIDNEIDVKMLVILGRPFFATGKVFVNGECGELMFRVNDEVVKFNIHKSMKYPSDINVVSHLDQIDKAVESIESASFCREPFAQVILNYDQDEIGNYDEVLGCPCRRWLT